MNCLLERELVTVSSDKYTSCREVQILFRMIKERNLKILLIPITDTIGMCYVLRLLIERNLCPTALLIVESETDVEKIWPELEKIGLIFLFVVKEVIDPCILGRVPHFCISLREIRALTGGSVLRLWKRSNSQSSLEGFLSKLVGELSGLNYLIPG